MFLISKARLTLGTFILFLSLNVWGVFHLSKEDFQEAFIKKADFKSKGVYEVVTIDSENELRIEAVFLNNELIRITFYPLKEAFKTEEEMVQLGMLFSNQWFLLNSTSSIKFYMSQEKFNNRLVGMLISQNKNDYFTSFQLYSPQH